MSINSVAGQSNGQANQASSVTAITGADVCLGAGGVGAAAMLHRRGRRDEKPESAARSDKQKSSSMISDHVSPQTSNVDTGETGRLVSPASADRTVNDHRLKARPVSGASSTSVFPLMRATSSELDSLQYLDLAGANTTPFRTMILVQEAPASLPSATLARAKTFDREREALFTQALPKDFDGMQRGLNELQNLAPQQLAKVLKVNLESHQLGKGKDGTAFAVQEYPALIGRATTKQIANILELELEHPKGVALLPVRYDSRLGPVGNDSTFGVPHAVVLRADDPRVNLGYVHASDVDFEKPNGVLAWLMPNCAGSHPMKLSKELEEKIVGSNIDDLHQETKREIEQWEQSLTSTQCDTLSEAKTKESQLHVRLKINRENLPEGRYLLSTAYCEDTYSPQERALLEKRDKMTKSLRQAKAIRKFDYEYMYRGGLRGLYRDDLLNGQLISSIDEKGKGNRFRGVMQEFGKGQCVLHVNPRGGFSPTFFSADAGKAIAAFYDKASKEYAERLGEIAGLPQRAYDRLAASMAIVHKAKSPVSLDFQHTNNMFLKDKKFRLIDIAFDKARRAAPNDTSSLLSLLTHGCFPAPATKLAERDETHVQEASQKIRKKITNAVSIKAYDLPRP